MDFFEIFGIVILPISIIIGGAVGLSVLSKRSIEKVDLSSGKVIAKVLLSVLIAFSSLWLLLGLGYVAWLN